MNLQPSHIDFRNDFMGTPLNDSDLEDTLRNIVRTCFIISPFKWVPFTLEQYKANARYSVYSDLSKMFDVLENGGNPSTTSRKHIEGGWIKKDGTTYSLTEKTLTLLNNYLYN